MISVRWLVVLVLLAGDGVAGRELPDYRYFRALSIDLAGRPPTRAELAAFEKPDFDFDAWIDTHLAGSTYSERLRRIYMDALRLEVGPSFQFVPNPLVLRREEVMGPDGKPLFIFFRRGQRRADVATDTEFCLTKDESGLSFPPNAQPVGEPKRVTQEILDARTAVVKPWWLYADYRAPSPSDLVGPDWVRRFPGFVLVPALRGDTSVRVCKEEAQTAETGVVTVLGHKDSGFAKKNKGRAVSCLTGTGFQNSAQCGCGVGLERCVPGAGPQFDPPAFLTPTHVPLGVDQPFDATPQAATTWEKLWWSEEAKRFIEKVFVEDRDFREVLTSRATEVNGPLAQFYRFFAGATCCGPGADLGYTQPEPLVAPSAIPEALVPEDTATWMPVADRGPRASGILTMPIFLTKYGSRRARAHVVYNAFLCKDFVADTVKLEPSSEPDLTKRPGCSTCHQTLEPMAAYFSRIEESNWTYLPATTFPITGKQKQFYDPAFDQLRGAYASPAHAEAGPAGLARDIISAPEFAPCVVQTVATSFLGRPLAPEDDAWKTQLVKTFVDGGYRMRTLVKAIVTSPRYRLGNDRR